MIDVLRETLAEVAAQAAALETAVGNLDGQLAGLVLAQLTVSADKLRSHLRKLTDKVTAATPRRA